jgi:hypothetical protein
MKKKEYTKPEMQVVNITSCTLLAASTMGQGGNGDEKTRYGRQLVFG